jgi:UDP-N-acetylmuramyl tripeptide synthase
VRWSAPTAEDGTPDWFAVKKLPDGREFRRPTPTWVITEEGLTTPDGELLPMSLKLPGNANRGNATQAIAAAVDPGCGGEPGARRR